VLVILAGLKELFGDLGDPWPIGAVGCGAAAAAREETIPVAAVTDPRSTRDSNTGEERGTRPPARPLPAMPPQLGG